MCNARHTCSISAHGRAGGAGNSLFLGIGERAGSIGTRRCAKLLAILRVCIVMNHSAQNPPRMQQPWYAPDGDQRKSTEISTGLRTSPSTDACPTPNCWKTQRRLFCHERQKMQNPVSGRNEMKHTADTLRNVILSCHSIRDARNLSHECTDCCYCDTGASLTGREAT